MLPAKEESCCRFVRLNVNQWRNLQTSRPRQVGPAQFNSVQHENGAAFRISLSLLFGTVYAHTPRTTLAQFCGKAKTFVKPSRRFASMALAYSFPPDAKARIEMLSRLLSKCDLQERADHHGAGSGDEAQDVTASLPGGELRRVGDRA